MPKLLTIVIPVFNEKETFPALLTKVEEAHLPEGVSREIIVVDDHSSDGTTELLQSLASHFKLVLQGENQGKGAAVTRGLKESSGDFVIIQDADLEYDPNDYEKLISPIMNGEVDVVYGSRFLGQALPTRMKKVNFWANKFLTLWSNIMSGLNLTDMETCYKVFSRKVVSEITPKLVSKRFGIEPELTALVKKYRIKELAITYLGRTALEGKKIGWKDGLESLYDAFWFNLKENLSQPDFLPLIIILIGLIARFVFLPLHITSDSQSYLEAFAVFKGAAAPAGFVPNRILTTPLGLSFVGLAELIFRQTLLAWASLNTLFFIFGSLVWYKIVKIISKDRKVALIALVLFITNYAVITFGLAYLMDMGGWAGFLLGAFAALKYLEKPWTRYLVLGGLSVGILGLVKEYAIFALPLLVLVVGYIHLYQNTNFKTFLKRVSLLGLISLLPILVAWLGVWSVFHYSYLNWYSFNTNHYSRPGLLEYIKVFGSLLTFAWLLFLAGILEIGRRVNKKEIIYLGAMLLSTCVLIVWPVITQRIQFLILLVPMIIASFSIKNKKIPKTVIFIVLVLYILSNYTMDSFVLPHVNIDGLFVKNLIH